MGKIGWLERLKGVKHIQIIACVAAIVIALAVYFGCVSCEGKSNGAAAVDEHFYSSDYCTAMRAQVEHIVSEISGVGSASVVINWDKSSGTALGGSENPHALSALVVCDGGGSTKVKLDVTYAVATLLDLNVEKIMVYPKSNK